MANNPLQHYFRQPKLYTRLPSGTSYYSPDIVEFTDNGEIGIMAMTAKDESALKNPDGLLNGEAIANVIKSCVPSVLNPKKLLSNDIDAIFIAIRHASYGDAAEINVLCPACFEKNTFELTIDQTLGNMQLLEESYTVTLPSNLEIKVRPFTYAQTMNSIQSQFEQHKITQSLTNNSVDDDARIKIISASFTKMEELNVSLITSAVESIKIDDENITTNSAHIRDFLCNIERADYETIEKMVSSINKIGVPSKFDAECTKCKHTWEADIDFNPINFSIAS